MQNQYALEEIAKCIASESEGNTSQRIQTGQRQIYERSRARMRKILDLWDDIMYEVLYSMRLILLVKTREILDQLIERTQISTVLWAYGTHLNCQ